MIPEKLKLELDSILTKHKKAFNESRPRENDLLSLKSNLLSAPDAASNLLDELIEVANEYMSEYDIDETEDIQEFVKSQVQEFHVFCQTGD